MERRSLWADMVALSDTIHEPWFVAGDFNSVLSFEDKVGGNPI